MPAERDDSGSPALDDRLDSWKEIAAYLKRDVTTVQRWEKRESMPVHRHVHDKLGSVYAFRSELELWTRGRKPQAPDAGLGDVAEIAAVPAGSASSARRKGYWLAAAVAGAVGIAAIVVALWVRRPERAGAIAPATRVFNSSPISTGSIRPRRSREMDGSRRSCPIATDAPMSG